MKTAIIAFLFIAALAVGSAQAEEAISYTVVEGDTLQSVAGKFDITVEQLRVSNGLHTETLTVGRVLQIPPKHATGFFDPVTGVYTVAKGDDLSAIGERFGVTVAELKDANALKSDTIQPGQTLSIPGVKVAVMVEATEVEVKPITSGTVTIESTSIGLGIGVSWGKGTLSYAGEMYPFKMKGLTLADLGISKVKVSGKVHNLKQLSDFAGTYKGGTLGLTVVAGGSSVKAKNEHGVVMLLSSYQEGADLNLGGEGFKIELE